MTALRRVLLDWWHWVSWRRGHTTAVSRSLAHDLGVPTDVVSRILDQTAADLRRLAALDEASDPRPVINRAIDELAKYGYHAHPSEKALMERCLSELPERDLTILRHFKQGKKHREIAALMGTDVDSVRRSLVKTYTDLRMKMRSHDDGKNHPSISPTELVVPPPPRPEVVVAVVVAVVAVVVTRNPLPVTRHS